MIKGGGRRDENSAVAAVHCHTVAVWGRCVRRVTPFEFGGFEGGTMNAKFATTSNKLHKHKMLQGLVNTQQEQND